MPRPRELSTSKTKPWRVCVQSASATEQQVLTVPHLVNVGAALEGYFERQLISGEFLSGFTINVIPCVPVSTPRQTLRPVMSSNSSLASDPRRNMMSMMPVMSKLSSVGDGSALTTQVSNRSSVGLARVRLATAEMKTLTNSGQFLLFPRQPYKSISEKTLLSTRVGFAIKQRALWLLAGIFVITSVVTVLFQHSVQTDRGIVRLNDERALFAMTFTFAVLYFQVLHYTNEELFYEIIQKFEPWIMASMIMRAWVAQAYDQFLILGRFEHEWARCQLYWLMLTLGYIYAVCFVDAMLIRRRLKKVYYLMGLLWAIFKFIEVRYLYPWSTDSEPVTLWLYSSKPNYHCVTAWSMCLLYYAKACLKLIINDDFFVHLNEEFVPLAIGQGSAQDHAREITQELAHLSQNAQGNLSRTESHPTM